MLTLTKFMSFFKLLAITCIILFGFTRCQKNSLNQYIPYESMEKSDEYNLRANGQKIFVAKEFCYGDRTFNTAQFFVKGKTTVEIECPDEIQQYEIRPYHLNIQGEVNDNKLTFTIDHPQMLFITVNNYFPLCLFQTPPEKNIPQPGDSTVLYFERGVHEAGVIHPTNGQTIYLEQGAIVKGRIYGENVKNVTIRGRGILDARAYTSKPNQICGLKFKNSENIEVDGIGLRTGEWWQSLYLLCNDVTVQNMNLMSFGTNNDGIDIDGVTDFRASNCFIGCGDVDPCEIELHIC